MPTADEQRNSTRIREALEAGLGWADCYEDNMGSDDFQRRDEDLALARGVLQHWREQEETEGNEHAR